MWKATLQNVFSIQQVGEKTHRLGANSYPQILCISASIHTEKEVLTDCFYQRGPCTGNLKTGLPQCSLCRASFEAILEAAAGAELGS